MSRTAMTERRDNISIVQRTETKETEMDSPMLM